MSPQRRMSFAAVLTVLIVGGIVLAAPLGLAREPAADSGLFFLRRYATGSTGVTRPSTTWYMAEGSSAGGFETWILVANPGSKASRVDLTYMTESGIVEGPGFTLEPGRRRSTNVADTVKSFNVSTKVTADEPVVAERSTYFGDRLCATGSNGITEPSTAWYLAEGASTGGYETWVLVQNPDAENTTVRITYMTDSGTVTGPAFTVAPGRRISRNVADTVKSLDVSTRVESDRPIVVERSTYFGNRLCATGSEGADGPSGNWYFAEGASSGGYETWILVQNPGTETANVRLNYMTEYGKADGPSFALAPGQRASRSVGDLIRSMNVSTSVSADRPVVAERSTYYNGRQVAAGSGGATAPEKTWFIAEGSSGEDANGGFETWVLVQNPGDVTARVELTYMTDWGPVPGPVFDLAPGTRISKSVGDTVKAYNVSTRVTADNPVVVERSTYWSVARPIMPSSYYVDSSGNGTVELLDIAQGVNVYVVNTGDGIISILLNTVSNVNQEYAPACVTEADGTRTVNLFGVAQGVNVYVVNTGNGIVNILLNVVSNINLFESTENARC